MKISPNAFRWYAAFHNADEHPHVHMMAWSADSSQGYLTESAKAGNLCAQHLLGKLFLTGREIPKDENMAKHWLGLSAEQGDRYAVFFA